MVESEIYEDADSKVMEPSKNIFSMYQDSQNKINNSSKKKVNKENESSSIYQDAQSKITNNSGQKNNNNYNNKLSKLDKERNLLDLKKGFLQKYNMLNDEHEEEKNIKNNLKEEIIYDNIEIYNNNLNKENINDNNEDKENESEYYEPEASNFVKNPTIFEGASQKGDCCNLPKCLIF